MGQNNLVVVKEPDGGAKILKYDNTILCLQGTGW